MAVSRERTPPRIRADMAIIIYLDYDGVMDGWPAPSETIQFVDSLKGISEMVSLRLLICRDDPEKILGALVKADIHTSFDQIIVTSYRTKEERGHSELTQDLPRRHLQNFEVLIERRWYDDSDGAALTQSHYSQSEMDVLQYMRYTGGTDEYICWESSNRDSRECNVAGRCILLVDGERETLEQVNRQASCVPAQLCTIYHDRHGASYKELTNKITEELTTMMHARR